MDLALSSLGERRAIRLFRSVLGSKSDLGRGDDCAVLPFGDGYLLVTTDVIVEGRHFLPDSKPYSIGWLVVAVNLSDIAAKGGRPLGLVVSIALPRTKSASFLKELARGMRDCARMHGTEVVGGDTKESGLLTLSGCAFGTVERERVMLRRGARPGDILAVTGRLGLAAGGHHCLKKRRRKGRACALALDALLMPEPLVEEGMALSRTGQVTSCMDLSDSLASSVHQLSRAGGVGFELELNSIPVAEEVRSLGLDPLESALYFGGDYQLLFTVKSSGFRKVRDALKRFGTEVTDIGKVVRGKGNRLLVNRRSKRLEDRSYDHFR